MEPIRLVVNGALGRMGREVINGLGRDPEFKIVGAVELKADRDILSLPDGSNIPLSASLERVLSDTRPQVLVDFTQPQATMAAVRLAAPRKVNLVVGTTGLTADDLKEIEKLSGENGVGAVVASNFALGAILMVHMAKIAARYLDWAEIIELHHHLKADAPSGTALSTARAMARAKGKSFSSPSAPKTPSESRGKLIEGITIHSVRLPGLMAHQEVIMGAAGQTLTIRHDTISRECYIPGITLAVKEVVRRKGLVYGLDALLGL